MSYAQAMRWHRKHPKGIRNLYLGFDCSSSPPPPKTVYLKFVEGCKEWQVINEVTVAEAFVQHPDAKRFWNVTSNFVCDGPQAPRRQP